METWERDIRAYFGQAGGTHVYLIHPETGKTVRGGILWPTKRGGHSGYIEVALHLPDGFPRAVFSLYTKHSVKYCRQAGGYVRYGGLMLSDKDHAMILKDLLMRWSGPDHFYIHSAYKNYEEGWESLKKPQEHESCPITGCTCAEE